MANIITSIRILCSIALLFFPPLSPAFYSLYLAAGITDMIDGPIARKTKTVSEFGSKLDTVADLVFAVVCLIKLIPVMNIPVWLYIWIGSIALVKMINIVIGFVRQKKFVAVHSILSKVAGALLFILPLTLTFFAVKYSASVVCAVATVAAVQEGYYIFSRKDPKKDSGNKSK